MSFVISVENSERRGRIPQYIIPSDEFVMVDRCSEEGKGVAILLKLTTEDYECFFNRGGFGSRSIGDFLFKSSIFDPRDENAILYTENIERLHIDKRLSNRLNRAGIYSLGDLIIHDAFYYLQELELSNENFMSLVNSVAIWLKQNFHLDVVIWHRVQRALLLSYQNHQTLEK